MLTQQNDKTNRVKPWQRKKTLKKNQKHRLERSAKPAGLRSF